MTSTPEQVQKLETAFAYMTRSDIEMAQKLPGGMAEALAQEIQRQDEQFWAEIRGRMQAPKTGQTN